MWSGGVSLISDIPLKEHWPLKTHLFLNAGRLDRLDLSAHTNTFQNTIRSLHFLVDKPLVDTARDLLAKPAISAGVGLIYKLNPIRLEVNFGVPLVASKTDKMQRGFQMGIGLEFL